MARTYYVTCPHCRRDYNVDKTLVDSGLAGVKLKCPYCKRDFIHDFPTGMLPVKKGAGCSDQNAGSVLTV